MGEATYAVRRTIEGAGLWRGKGPRLRHLDCELTERCDNACQHCYINLAEGDETARARELSTGEWGRILGGAAELGALSVRFTGGEPLLREDFSEIYLLARKLGMKVQLFTNARGITEELAGLLARVPPLEKIEVTVYGMRAESYEAAACAPEAFGEFRRGLERLLEHQIPLTVKWAMLPPNRGEREEFEAWARTLPGMDETPSAAMYFDLRARRDSPARDRRIARLRVDPEEGAALLARKGEGSLREMRRFCGRFMGAGGDELFGCGAGANGCVDAYGRYQACMLLRDPALSYDLRKGSLQDALENLSQRLRGMKATHREYLERCARCFLHGLCEQCPAKAWSEHGVLDRPVEYLCQAAHAQARMLGLLVEGERGWEVMDWQDRVKRLESGGI